MTVLVTWFGAIRVAVAADCDTTVLAIVVGWLTGVLTHALAKQRIMNVSPIKNIFFILAPMRHPKFSETSDVWLLQIQL